MSVKRAPVDNIPNKIYSLSKEICTQCIPCDVLYNGEKKKPMYSSWIHRFRIQRIGMYHIDSRIPDMKRRYINNEFHPCCGMSKIMAWSGVVSQEQHLFSQHFDCGRINRFWKGYLILNHHPYIHADLHYTGKHILCLNVPLFTCIIPSIQRQTMP